MFENIALLYLWGIVLGIGIWVRFYGWVGVIFFGELKKEME